MTTNVQFEIVEANEADHTVTARFWTDRIGQAMLGPQTDEAGEPLLRPDGSFLRIRTDTCIGLPAGMALDPESQVLRDFVLQFAPRAWFEVLEAKLDGQVGPVTPLLGGASSLEVQAERELQFRLNAWARTRFYDGIVSLCGFANSTNPRYAAEGQRGVAERDRVWMARDAIMGEVAAGTRPMPTLDQLLAEIPDPTWGDV